MDRRTFLSRITSIFSLITAALISLPFFRFLFASVSSENAHEGWSSLVRIDAKELSEDVSPVRYMRIVREGWQSRIMEEVVWVRKKKDGSFVVFNTHLHTSWLRSILGLRRQKI